MKAKDLMIPIQDYLGPENTLKEAANLLRIAKKGEEKIGVKGLPVLDKEGKLDRDALNDGHSQSGSSVVYGSHEPE